MAISSTPIPLCNVLRTIPRPGPQRQWIATSITNPSICSFSLLNERNDSHGYSTIPTLRRWR